MKVGENCPRCHREVTLWCIKEGKRRRIQNALNSTEKRKLNGTKPGPPRLRNDKEILKLRTRGLSIRKIARMLNTSPSTVHNSLKALK